MVESEVIEMNVKIELVVENSKRIYRFGEVTEITIGRADDNILSPLVDQISRHHARVFFKDGTWMVQDLESMNGSFRNDAKLDKDPVALSAGDKLRFGPVEAVVFFEDGSKAVPQDAAAPSPVVKPALPGGEPAAVQEPPAAPKENSAATPEKTDDIPELSPDEIESIAELKPVEANEPPKNDSPISPISPITPVKPEIKKPVLGAGALKPGLKLPSKPALGAGLKLPQRPAPLGAGLKVPPKPGFAKPGLKLPPKPGLNLPPSSGAGLK